MVVLVIQQQVKLGQDPEIGAKNNMVLEPIALSLGVEMFCFLKENDGKLLMATRKSGGKRNHTS